MPTTTAATPLRSSRLRRIVAAYTINRLGTWFGFIALSVAVFDHTHSAIAVAGLLLAGQVLPAFLVPALVARVETSTRRGELSALYFFEAAATAALAALLLWHIWLPAILLLVALDGTAALAAGALLRAAAARAAREWAEGERDRLGERDEDEGVGVGVAFEASAIEAERRANAALNIGFAVTFTLGPVLGGIVVTTLGAPVALLIDTVSFIACGAMLLDLKPHVEDAETSTVAGRVKAAWRYITQTATLRRLLIAESVALVFFEFSPPIEVAYAKLSLHAGAKGYGILLGVWGLGVALGSVFFARSIKRSLKVMLSGSTLAVGLAYLGWATAPSLALASFAGLIGGVGNGVQWAALISAVQRITPQALQGRLMGAVESLGAIFPAFGFALSSGIVALSSPRTAFLVAGIGATLSTFAFLGLQLGTYEGEHAEPTDAADGAGEPASQDVPVGANASDAGFAGAQPTPGG
jgi:MFS family permease